MSVSRCQFAPLPSLGSIAIRGADAHSFLVAQLSQLPPGPSAESAALAAWHDAKGRVQALFRVLHREDDFLLLTHASVVEDVATALSRYVLRAQVEVAVAAGHDAGTAVVGDCVRWLGDHGVSLGADAGALARHGDIDCLRLGPALVHLIAPPNDIERLAGDLTLTSPAVAELAEIRLGLPTVSAPLRGLFLPQMLNLDLLGGIAFDKGCYPGQEIIARTQNLGTVKRRLRHFAAKSSGAAPTPGTRLVDAASREVGVVVRAAVAGGELELLAVVELDAIDGTFSLDTQTGATLQLSQAVD
jgi:hypothetical protein